MHFSIPETSEERDAKGNAFKTYHIHINGVRHCVLRFRQLHALHEQLRRELPFPSAAAAASRPAALPPFPPKKLLPLTVPQLEERRAMLEKYLQRLSQDARVSNGVTFNGFLLAAQMETRAAMAASDKAAAADSAVSVDVFLMNDQKVTVRGKSILQTDEVLERACRQLGVPDEHVYHFGLFLIQRRKRDDCNGAGGSGCNENTALTEHFSVVRKLQDFESPYISQKVVGGNLKLVMRKASWDPQIDEELMTHAATLNLLYVQTVAEVERGWVRADPETKRQLARMQARGAKKEYMETALSLPMFGYVHFAPCVCDYPASNTPAHVAVGRRELVMKVRQGATGELKEGSFKVTKMRCWRIMTVGGGRDNDLVIGGDSDQLIGDDHDVCPQQKLELSFEYLMNTGELQWVTVVSTQAILMSLCLQSMVEELLRIRSGAKIKMAGEKSCSTEYLFPRKDGSTQRLQIRSGLHAEGACGGNSRLPKIDLKTLASMTGRQYSVQKLSERFDRFNFRDASRAAEDLFIENEAFVDVRDNDDDNGDGGDDNL